MHYFIKRQNRHHTETSQLICRENQLTGFYIDIAINPFHVPDLFLYPLKISESQSFSDVSRGIERD